MKGKKLLCMLLMTLFTALGLAFSAACNNSREEKPKKEGPETGVYYYDSDEGEYLVSLCNGDQAIFTAINHSVVGTYTVESTSITFTLPKTEQKGNADKYTTIPATLGENALTITYEDTEWRFLKKVTYSVVFDTGITGENYSDSAMNGKTVAKPADPTRKGYVFFGWYADKEYQKLYNFETEAVTKDTTLYAYWVPVVPGQTEYQIRFDLNYAGAASLAPMQTIGGQLYNVVKPEREGFDFGGWWVSSYNDADKLSYAYDEDMVFSENLILYAKWLPRETGKKLTAPIITVTSNGITWTNTKAASYWLQLSFVADNGEEKILLERNNLVGNGLEYDFSAAAAGDYIVRMRSNAGLSENNSDTTAVYYANKGLARVSSFSVSDGALIFNAVPHAEKYLITIDCGNKEHNHTRFDNGNSTYYNFSNCEMQEGGIKFTVTAVADGYASSTSETFIYKRTLEAVSDFAFDGVTETLSWKAVPAAASYIVTIKRGSESITLNVGGKTQICLKQYAPAEGGIQVSVYPKTKGYNSPEAASYTYNKTTLATPSDIRISGTMLSWAPVDGAEKYEICIGDKIFMTKGSETSFDLSSIKEEINWTKAADYRLTIRSTVQDSAQNSAWSDDIDIRYYALYSTLFYAEGQLSWRHVVGASAYQVKVDDGAAQTVDDGSNFASILFKHSGENILSVRFFDGKDWSDWATLVVKTYEISFDSRAGKGVESIYKAMGDPMDLPDTTRAGYDFGGWYNSVSGANGNGALYADEFFNETGDIMLYAYWKPGTFKIVYDCGEGNTVGSASGDVVFGKNYRLDIPTPADGVMMFVGWYSEANGKGIRYTDETGKSLATWNLPNDVRAIAYWVEMFKFTKVSDGYSVVRNKSISSSFCVNITIPATYQGPDDENPLPVTVVDGAAFEFCRNLVSMRIPNNVKVIESTAFNYCESLEYVELYQVEGVKDPLYYSTSDGTVIYKNPRTQAIDLFYVPQGFTGDENGTYFISDGVTNIPYRAFNKNVFTEIVVSTDVLSVEEGAFYNCANLAKVSFVKGGTDALTFRGDIFKSCTALEEISLPARIVEFTPDFLASSSSLQKIYIEESENIPYSSKDGMLFNKSQTEILYCPAGRTGKYEFASTVTSVGDKAFYKCKKLQEVVFNGWMSFIGESAFEGCTALAKITFKGAENNEALKLTVEKAAFQGCSALAEVLFEENSRVTEIEAYAFKDCGKLTALTLPASLETIGAGAFQKTKIASLTFAQNGKLKTIGDSAFSELPLVSLQFPASLETIGENAFYYNASLISVEFAESDTPLTLRSYAFQSCSKLESITIPKNVISIEGGVFERCSKLATIIVDEENEHYLTADGVLFDKEFKNLLFYPAGKTDTFVLPESVTTIGEGVFRGNKSLTSISIGKQVTTIADYAFFECSNLEEVIFDLDTVQTEELVLGKYAFNSCDALVSLNLPARVKTIPDYFIKGGHSLGSLTLPDTIEKIGKSAFQDTALANLTIPASVTSIGDYAFSKITSTSGYTPPKMNVVFEEGGEPLTVDEKVFYKAPVESVKLPERLTNISKQMFYNCTLLKEIEIPSSVIKVEYAAFSDCKGLVTVVFKDSENPDRKVEIADGDYTSGDHGGADYYYGVFSGNTALKNVTLPKGLTRVADYMFYGCTALEQITIPNTITNGSGSAYAVGMCAFKNCTGLKTVDFQTGGKGEITIGGSGTYYSSPTSTVTVPRLNSGAFYGCKNLETVNFPENLAGATDVKGFKIGAVSASGQIFYDCTSLKAFNVATGTATDNYYYTTESGLLCYKSGDEDILLMCAPGATGKIVVPNTITKISHLEENLYKGNIVRIGFSNCNSVTEIEFEANGEKDLVIDGNFYVSGSYYYGAFNNMAALEKVTLPARLTTLGGCSFADCPKLADVTFAPDSRLTSIEQYAFYNTGFETITIPDSVKTLGGYLFMKSKLKAVTLPATVNSLDATFSDCTTLEELTFTGEGDVNFASVNGVVYKLIKDASGTALGRELTYYPYAKKDTSFEVPADVVKIGESAFKGHPSLQTLTFANSNEALKSDFSNELVIGEAAFQECKVLKSVALPARLTTVARIAFANCPKLAAVTFEDACALQTISEGMFWKCAGLVSITIPKRVTAIENGALSNCAVLKTVTFAAEGSPVQLYAEGYGTSYSSNIPDSSNNSYKFGVFIGCKQLAAVNFNKRLNGTTIPAYTFHACEKLNVLENVNIQAVETYAFYNCKSLGDDAIDFRKFTSETIDKYAFYGCAKLTTISLSDTIKTIDSYAFNGCTSLQKVELTTNVETINGSAFLGCSKLSSINLEKVQYIAASAFKNCTALTAVDLSGFLGYDSSNLTVLGANTFEGCTLLATVKLPDTLTKIGNTAFKNCKGLVSFTLPAGLETIGESVFEGCANLGTIDLSQVKYIGKLAFLNCEALTFADLSSFIGYNASNQNKMDKDTFRNTGLTSFTFDSTDPTKTNVIPAEIKSMGYGVFAQTAITSLTFEDNADTALSLSGGGTSTSATRSFGVFEGCTALASVDFAGRRMGISTAMFRDCTSLKELAIGNAVTSISANAFYGCKNLEKVAIPTDGQLTKIVKTVFTNMTTLKTVEFTSGDVPGTALTTIEDNAFQNTGIAEIVIPTSVTNIGKYAFEGNKQLASVTFAGDAENKSNLQWIGSGWSNTNKYASYSFANCPLLKTVAFPEADEIRIGDSTFTKSGLEEVTLSDGVAAIGYGAFKDCAKLAKVNVDAAKSKLSVMNPYAFANTGLTEMPAIPAKMTSIPAYAFSGCNRMTKAIISSNVATIYENAFENCTNLTQVELRDGVTNIEGYAFQNCTALAAIELPATLVSIGENPFAGCINLELIDVVTANKIFSFVDGAFYADNTLVMVKAVQQGAFTVPARVTEIAPGAFAGTEISSIVFENPDTIIGSSAFAYMKKLQSVTLPANLTEIPERAFEYSGLTHLTLPATITKIGDYAFQYSALESMTLPETVTSVGDYAFYGCAALETLTFGAEEYAYFGEYVFAKSAVSSITLPKSVTEIHAGMFEGCSNLETLTITGAVTSIGANAFKGCPLTEFVVPNTVTSLAGGAFKGSVLENIVFADGGEKLVLGDWSSASESGSAFAGLTSLKSVTLARIEVIPANLFANCTNLTTVTLPANLTTIGKYAFKNTGTVKTAGAESFVIPATVTKINYGAFLNSAIAAVTFAEGEDPITLTAGSEYSGKVSSEGVFHNTKNLKSVTWSSRVTVIPKFLFYGSGIEQIDLPEGLTKIDGYAFAASQIRSAVIPSTISGVPGTYLFSECKNLETVTLSANMTTISIAMFKNSSLQRIVIPEKITSIYTEAFSGCSQLTSVTILGETVKISKQTFKDCTAIKELILPAETTADGVDVFSGWTEAQTIKIMQSTHGATWTTGWDNGCKANIIWKEETPQA